MIRLEWTEPAVEDPEEIKAYISRDSALYAVATIELIVAASEALAMFPKRGRIVPEMANPHVREVIVGSYRVIYRIKTNSLQILSVIHGARDLRVGLH